MNFEVLKTGFREYLEKNDALTTKESGDENGQISIFLHVEEFKKYLVEELNADISITKKSLSEIKALEIADGKIVDPNDPEVKENAEILEAIEQEKEHQQLDKEAQEGANSDTPIADGAEVPPADTDTASADDGMVTAGDTQAIADENGFNLEDADLITCLLNELLGDEVFLKAVDKDGSGALDQEELQNMLAKLNSFDDDIDNFTLDDIIGAVNQIKEGRFDINTLDSAPKDEEEFEETQNTSYDAQAAADLAASAGPSKYGAFSGGYTGGSSGGSSSGIGSKHAQTGLATKTLSELQAMLPDKVKAVSDAQDELAKVTSGEKYASQKEELDGLQKAYQDALDNEANATSNPDAAALSTCIGDIATCENTISEYSTSLVQLTVDVSAKLLELSGAQTNLATLQKTLENNSKIKPSESMSQEAIDAKNAELTAQITSAQREVDRLQGEYDQLVSDKNDMETKLSDEQNRLSTLQQNKLDLETSLKENASQETQDAMKAYNDAKAEYDRQQQSDLKTATDNLTTAQNELNEVQGLIQTKQAQEAAKEYSVDPILLYNEDVGKALMKNALTTRGTTGLCLAGVNDTLRETFGLTLNFPSAYMAADALRGVTPGYEELSSHFAEVEVPRDQLASLPAGAIVVWNNNLNDPDHPGNGLSSAGRTHGHISVSLGDGRESSDHIQSQSVNRDAAYSVFIPIA